VVQGIVRAHDAAITVTSSPGAGTRFRVLFPVLPADAVCAKPVPAREKLRLVSSPPPHRAATILVIDDDESVGELAEAVLERVGYDVLLASGGREGLEILEKNKKRIALVVLDLAMPDMSGEVVLRRIRRSFPDLPVVISSGYAEAIAGARVRSTRRVDYVAKPYEPDTLVERVRSMLPAS
jgi:CheY-like chemotaxis protein